MGVDREANQNIKVCDKDGDGGINQNQGPCTLKECRKFCEKHSAGFKCKYYQYELADEECYLYESCRKMNSKDGHVIYQLGGGNFPVLHYDWADSGCSETKGLRALAKLALGDRSFVPNAVIGPGYAGVHLGTLGCSIRRLQARTDSTYI